mmetsp:Transcript_57605/g.184998  ORF Transcript_57605/g.184998 Transcript_57605/m.184998 type:complete len:235 (-) Transcript_57605:864-1568(-)
MPPAMPSLPAACSCLPSSSATGPSISSRRIAGMASKSCVFIWAMRSMIFIFMSSSSAANWQVGGRQSCTVRWSMLADSFRSQKPWHPTALWSASKCSPPDRRCNCEATRLPKQTKTCWSLCGACLAASSSGDMKLVKGMAYCQSRSFSSHHLAAPQLRKISLVGAFATSTVTFSTSLPHLATFLSNACTSKALAASFRSDPVASWRFCMRRCTAPSASVRNQPEMASTVSSKSR